MENTTDNETINLVHAIHYTKKHWKIIFLFFLLGIALALAQHFFVPKTYLVKSVIQIGSLSSDETQIIETPDQLASRLNYTFLEKYPSFKATAIDNLNLVGLENSSSSLVTVKNPLLDIQSAVLKQHADVLAARNDLAQEKLKNLQDRENHLLQIGQQIAPLELAIFDLQYKTKDVLATRVIEEPIISTKKDLGLFTKLIIGAVLGIFLGLVFLFAKNWWSDNKL